MSPSPRQLRDRIEREDYSENDERFRDYFHEPPSSMANYSRSTMLYGYIMVSGKLAPLARLVRPGLFRCAPRLNDVTETC